MRKHKKRNKTLKEFIDYYMEGNLQRFLRKHKKQYWFKLTYSYTLRKVKKSNKKAYKIIISKGLYPRHLGDILNVFITLDKYFDIGFTIRAFNDILEIEEELMTIIYDYMSRVSSHRYHNNMNLFKKHWVTDKQALQEQKARGFIHINDFEDFDEDSYHLVSNVDRNYYYPMNIETSTQQAQKKGTTIKSPYVIGSMIAVEGWTRIEEPGKI